MLDSISTDIYKSLSDLPEKFVKDTTTFIIKARLVHGDFYDYSEVDYKNSIKKIKIICPIHGSFEQIPNSHLNGSGCHSCKLKKFHDLFSSNTEEFIKKARKVHGDFYDYSDVSYINSKTKIKIICPIHGEFEQTPSKHLFGRGCNLCKGGVKYTKEQFIEKATGVHEGKYDYSQVDYTNSHTKIKIICLIHGSFEQTPNAHIVGQGCPKCVGKNKTTDEFIEMARKIHGNKFDYSLTNYKNSKIKVKIICQFHGLFEQTPSNHLNGQGCPECGFESISKSKTKTTDDFIKKAQKVHNDKYDYTKVNYINGNTKVIIICPIHGEFEQKPSIHLNCKGCQKCKIVTNIKKQRKEKQRKTTEQFIEEARNIHNNFYSYHDSHYINSKIKIEITCPVHGNFWQLPSNHLKGCGCPECFKERNLLEWQKRYPIGSLYLLECFNESERFLKIGITSKTIQGRYPTKERMPYNYEILYETKRKSKDVVEIEQYIKEKYTKYIPSMYFGGSISESLNFSQKDSIIKDIKKFISETNNNF